MFVTLLVLILSDDPLSFGVIKRFDSPQACYKYMIDMDVPLEKKKNLGCIEIRKPVEV